MPRERPIRRLAIILGDQLDLRSAVFDGWDVNRDAVWMAEVEEESTHVPSHRARTVLFLSAMRHFRNELKDKGIRILYHELGDAPGRSSLAGILNETLLRVQPESLVMLEAGDYRVGQAIAQVAQKASVELEVRPDRSFYCSRDEFAAWAKGRKELRLEYFYREMRRRHRVLMSGSEPEGGEWNLDKENRKAFGKTGPLGGRKSLGFEPDRITLEVISEVKKRFPKNPGELDSFAWPVNRLQALELLQQFIKKHLAHFGDHQDAMWTDEPFLHHSLIASSLNLRLLDPREVVDAAEAAYRKGKAPLNAVEGFIRQILGWREYVRGIYLTYMPEYGTRNALGAHQPLPEFYWTAQTDMHCLSQAITQTLEHGYAHHIQRLMVTGLFSLLLGIDPKAIHEWYLSVYVDAVEWVELPNTIGMSQFADGGLLGSKPYIASGAYIDRMSNYCSGCRYDPSKSQGEDACPFTVLYWDFVDRHRKLLARNPRTGQQVRNYERFDDQKRREIKLRAARLREDLARR